MKSGSKGFSLLELVVVVAIVGLLGAVAIPMIPKMIQKQRLSSTTRETLGFLRQARGLGASGRSQAPPPPPPPPPCITPPCPMAMFALAPPILMRYGGIRIMTTTSYVLFGDADGIIGNSNEVDLAIVDFQVQDPNSTVVITSPPPGTEIRFQSNGLMHLPVPGANAITLRDSDSGLTKTIVISAGGIAKLQ